MSNHYPLQYFYNGKPIDADTGEMKSPKIIQYVSLMVGFLSIISLTKDSVLYIDLGRNTFHVKGLPESIKSGLILAGLKESDASGFEI